MKTNLTPIMAAACLSFASSEVTALDDEETRGGKLIESHTKARRHKA